MLALQLLALLVVVNGAPILARRLLGNRGALAVDLGMRFPDGRPWLGSSKTWRGIVAAAAGGAVAAPLLGLAPALGVTMALWAMLGDLLSSFIKRRAGIEPSGNAPVLDQVPEALLPVLAVQPRLGLEWTAAAAVVAGFVLINLVFSPLLHRLGIRHRPH